MKKINPFFELKGNRYELKTTRWLVAEYRRLNEENPLSEEDKENAIKASNLVADVRKYAEKADECWVALCEEPTEENQRIYLLFKSMSDKAIQAYNEFVSTKNTLQVAAKHNIDILEQVAIKALAEQYFSMNEAIAKQTWEEFVDETDNQDIIVEWLNAMAECLFVTETEVEDNSFLAQKRKMELERQGNRKVIHRAKK